MKFEHYKNYSPEELLGHYEAPTWNDFFNFQCAIEGIPLLPEYPGPKPSINKPPTDVIAYELCGMAFTDRNQAEEIYALITKEQFFRTAYGTGRTKYLEPFESGRYDYPKIETTHVYSKEAYDKIKSEITKQEENKKNWEKLSKQYKEIEAQRDDLLEQMTKIIFPARDRRDLYDSMLAKYKTYLEMAEEDSAMAKRFLKKAFPDYAISFPEFFEEPIEAAESDQPSQDC